jgi:tRNA-dihydrouridine synthase
MNDRLAEVLTAVDLARRFEAAGADALTFHPRFAPDHRSHPSRWEYSGLVKRAVSIFQAPPDLSMRPNMNLFNN